MSEAENPPAFPSDRTQQDTLKADRPWQPWERNFSGGRIGVQEQQGVNENWMILHVESGGATTTTSLRHHEAWDLALMLSPQLKARLEQLFNDKRATDAALHSLTWRECDTDLLRRIADERDCGPGCEKQGGWAHCPMIDRGECGFAEAESLRDLAKGIDLANATLEADVMRVVDSCGGAEQPDESADWSRGYNEALDAVQREMKRFFAPPPNPGARIMQTKGEYTPGPLSDALLNILDAVRDYLPPDGISEQDFISRVIWEVDNPAINPIIRELENGRH